MRARRWWKHSVAERFFDDAACSLLITDSSSPTSAIETACNEIDGLLNHGGAARWRRLSAMLRRFQHYQSRLGDWATAPWHLRVAAGCGVSGHFMMQRAHISTRACLAPCAACPVLTNMRAQARHWLRARACPVLRGRRCHCRDGEARTAALAPPWCRSSCQAGAQRFGNCTRSHTVLGTSRETTAVKEGTDPRGASTWEPNM